MTLGTIHEEGNARILTRKEMEEEFIERVERSEREGSGSSVRRESSGRPRRGRRRQPINTRNLPPGVYPRSRSNSFAPDRPYYGHYYPSNKPMELSEKISKFVIEARCTDKILFSIAATIGVIVVFLQSLPIVLNNWVYVTEPRPINKTGLEGEQQEAVFHYNIGYLQICRRFLESEPPNHNFNYTYDMIPQKERDYQCHLNPLITREELGDEFSLASLAISARLGLSTLLHLIGTIICGMALILATTGHLRHTMHTMISGVCYICGCLILSTAVLMLVCVVDDELSPRMKMSSSGEATKFSFAYGYPFWSSVSSILPVQMCACLQSFLYFRRFPTVVEKLQYVPGLEEKLRNAQMDKELGIPPMEIHKRGSLASYMPFPSFSMALSGRPSPTRSSQMSLRNNSIVFVQEM
ncbi:unnamed protein product, partial [Mesorhabditis belari]|uniref:Uncharacterized protein n=1 Tax=Mesorhabditis belari TaxID=2138241 RepID=A0AAF3ETN8_9BILA